MMILASLALLSLVSPARAEVPALITGTWRMTGMPRDNGEYLYDEFTQNANGDYTGKGWGTWDVPVSGTNNYTYSGVTSDVVCETDATTGAVSVRYEYSMILDYDLGANPLPSWNTPSGQKQVICGYNTYDTTTDIMTVTAYNHEDTTIALSVDPGACPATANTAATTSGWWTSTADVYTYKCVANCADWACDSTDSTNPLVVEDAESAGVGKPGVGAFRSLVATLVITLALWYRQ
jgi:hypothetical protein